VHALLIALAVDAGKLIKLWIVPCKKSEDPRLAAILADYSSIVRALDNDARARGAVEFPSNLLPANVRTHSDRGPGGLKADICVAGCGELLV
jgi:hypothetical protein